MSSRERDKEKKKNNEITILYLIKRVVLIKCLIVNQWQQINLLSL
jgi:hypothetical protein